MQKGESAGKEGGGWLRDKTTTNRYFGRGYVRVDCEHNTYKQRTKLQERTPTQVTADDAPNQWSATSRRSVRSRSSRSCVVITNS